MFLLITGHKGSIGRRLMQRLLQLGHQVMGVDIQDGNDCANIQSFEKFEHVQVVFHLAAHIRNPQKNTMDACDGVLEYCQQKKVKLIYASSCAVYNPWTMYGIHKLYGDVLFRSNLSDVATLRLFNVYGGDGTGVIDKIEAGQHLMIDGSGDQRRDYVHVDDVVNAFVAAFSYDWQGVVDIGTGKSYSVNELIKMSRHKNFSHVRNDGGPQDSYANLNKDFPWKAQKSLEQYLHAKASMA